MSSIKNYNTLIKQNRTPESNEAASPDIKNSKDTKNEEDKETEKTEPETGINKWYRKYNKELFLGLAIILCIEIFTTYKNNFTGVTNTSYTRKRSNSKIINMKGGVGEEREKEGDATSGISNYIMIFGLLITFLVFIFCLATPSIIIIGSIVLCYYSIKMQLPQLTKMGNKMTA